MPENPTVPIEEVRIPDTDIERTRKLNVHLRFACGNPKLIDLDLCEDLIEAGIQFPSPSLEDPTSSPLFNVIKYAHYEEYEHLIYLLLNAGADPNTKFLDTPITILMIQSCEFTPAFLDSLSHFIKAGANLDAVDKFNNTALIIACMRWRVESYDKVVKMLMKAGANLDLQSNDGMTALMVTVQYSAFASNIRVAQMLIDAGANLDVQTYTGRSALMIASEFSNRPSSETAVQMLIDAGANLECCLQNGNTALMIASMNSIHASTEDTVQMLIDAGANINHQNELGLTALDYAITSINSYSSEETVQMLIDAGANVNNIEYSGGFTTLMTAARHSGKGSSVRALQILLDAGANIHARSKDGWTAFTIAVRYLDSSSCIEAVKLLDTEQHLQLS